MRSVVVSSRLKTMLPLRIKWCNLLKTAQATPVFAIELKIAMCHSVHNSSTTSDKLNSNI